MKKSTQKSLVGFILYTIGLGMVYVASNWIMVTAVTLLLIGSEIMKQGLKEK